MCLFLFFSCDSHQPQPSETIHLEQADGELQRIAKEARSTLDFFFRYQSQAGAGEHGFYVKYILAADDGSGIDAEQVWLTGIKFKNSNLYGDLANTPLYVQGLRKGSTIMISVDSIVDWMYIREGKIIGGYSIKYLLEKIPESRRSDRQRELLSMYE